MRLRILILLFLLAAALSCGEVQEAKTYKLSSGKEIKVSSVRKMNLPDGNAALVMSYETDIRGDDTAGLRREVDQIWEVFRPDVESAQVRSGVIRVTHAEGAGFVKSGKGYGFVYVKGEDNKWRRLDDGTE